jgi:polysaccharide biosynthesis protein PelF
MTVTALRPADGLTRTRRRPSAHRPRVLMITEGTYPYTVGGVSSWCDAMLGRLTDIDWAVLPIVAGDKRLRQSYALPRGARLLRPIELWSDASIPPRVAPGWPSAPTIAAQLLRGLLPWHPDHPALTAALVRCRRHPRAIRHEFRSRRAWEMYLQALAQVLREADQDVAPAPIYDALEAARLYQSLYWVARAAAVPTPRCDLVHATAAGWSVIPALVHKALSGTPLLLTEHGVFVRESYLASVRDPGTSLARHHMSTRLALGLTRAAYATADVVAPVTSANAAWERRLGVEADRIRVIPNGIDPPGPPMPPPRTNRVVAIGRIDPLKDVQTMLLVADEVRRRVPDVRFEYWGPPGEGQQAYARACERMRRQLGLDGHFAFMGRTDDPQKVLRGADVVLMTSISEAMPMALLEAMAQGRPAVATSVGGISDVVHGCGLVAQPGNVNELATAVATILHEPALAAELGRRGYERLCRRYTLDRCVASYREVIAELVEGAVV